MKKILQDRLSLKLAVNDMFQTMNYRTESMVGLVAMRQNFNLDTRTVLLSATFKIGKERQKARPHDQEIEEQQRVRGAQ